MYQIIKKNTIFFLLVLSMISSGLTLFSQTPNLLLDHYSEREGLTTIQVLTITQDEEGYVWMGTENGLVRYDGHRFKYFKYNIDDSTSIRSNYIKHFSLDKHHRLWLFTNDHFGYFDTKELKYKVLKITSERPKNLFRFRYDAKNDITYLICQNGVFTITGKKAAIKKIALEGMADVPFTDFIAVENQFIGSSIYGIFVFDQSGKKVKRYFRPGVSSKNENANDFLNLHYDGSGKLLYIGCWSNGLYTLNLADGNMQQYLYNDKPNMQNGIIAIHAFSAFGFENTLLLGTMGGLKVFDKQKKELVPFSHFLFPNKQVVEGEVTSLYEDRNHNLWIGSLNGIYKLDARKQLFRRIPIPMVEGWVIDKMFVDQSTQKDSILWLLYGYASLLKIDLIHSKIVPLPAQLEPYAGVDNENNDFLLDQKGRIWLASNKNGIVLYDQKKQTLHIPTIVNPHKKPLSFLQIHEDKKCTIYISGIYGLYKYNESTQAIQEVSEFTAFIAQKQYGLYVRDVCFDNQNRMWAIALKSSSPDHFLYCLDFSKNKFFGYRQNDHSELKQLASFENITTISRDRILINSFTGFGIGGIVNSQLQFTSHTHSGKKPIISNRTATMDDHENIWICSDNGMYLYKENQNRLAVFNQNNSAIDKTWETRICYSPQSQTLYFNQKGYLLACETGQFTQEKRDKIRLTDLAISNLPGILPSNFNKLKLRPDQNTIQLHFSNLNLTNSSDNYYEYRLNGDSTWIGIEGSELHFNNMGYGDYLLEVRGYNSFGMMSSENYTAVFSILPPYYRTWWFQVLIFCILLTGLYLIFRLRELQYKKLVKIRLNIARDLHDDLGSNLSSIKILSELSASSAESNDKDVLKHIAEKSRAMMASISDIVWSINPVKDTLEELIHKIQVFAIESLESIDVNLHFDVPDRLPDMAVPLEYRRHLFLIFKEGINNIAKYSGAQHVYFSVEVTGKTLTMILKDDGKGFNLASASDGNGMHNMRSRADEMQARLNIESSEAGTSVIIAVNIP